MLGLVRERLAGWLRRALHDVAGCAYARPGSGAVDRLPVWPFVRWTADCSVCGERLVRTSDLRWRHTGELW